MENRSIEDMYSQELELIERGVKVLVSASFLRSIHYNIERDASFHALEKSLTWEVTGNTIHTDTKTYQRPKGWLDMFKKTFFPLWLQRIFPIHYEEILVETRFIHVCPHVELPADHSAHIAFLTKPEI